ncbi:MAG TPA: hypothetical protein VMU14_12030 [Acidimicrobiales bacterium]|nr:hypothetical protein [Acidimicrobiales bacterium]
MARRSDSPVFRQHQKVAAAHDLPGVPAGTTGKVLLVNGFSWVRYRVRFDNGAERGMLSADDLTTAVAAAEQARLVATEAKRAERAAAVEALRAKALADEAARKAPSDEGSAA